MADDKPKADAPSPPKGALPIKNETRRLRESDGNFSRRTKDAVPPPPKRKK